MVGICRGFIPFLVEQLQREEDQSMIELDTDVKSWFASLTLLPTPIGCLVSGVLTDVLGRKSCIIRSFVPFFIAWGIMAVASNTWMVGLATTLNGIASGMTYCSAAYIAEISRPKHRGLLLTLVVPTITFGTMICNVLVHLFKWRLASTIFMVVSIASMFSMMLLPESPTYLMKVGKKDEATKVLTWLRSNGAEVSEEIASLERENKQTEKITDLQSILKECVMSWKPLLIIVILTALQLLAGYPIFVVYITTIFDDLRIPFKTSVAAILFSSVCCVASLITPFLIATFGRKKLLSFSALGMGLSLTISAIYESLFLEVVEKQFYWIVLVGVYMYCASLTCGVMIMTFVMPGEIFAPRMRGIMCGISGVAVYLLYGFVIKSFPYVLSTIGIVNCLWLFVVFSFLNIPFALFVLPETHGKTLNEIQETYFSSKTTTNTSHKNDQKVNDVFDLTSEKRKSVKRFHSLQEFRRRSSQRLGV